MTSNAGVSQYLPHTTHFLLNDKCNAKCVFCGGDYYRSNSGRSINLEKFRKIADNIHLEHFRTICLAGAGDPLISPDFMPIVRYTNERYPNIGISVTTNGIALSPELSSQILASNVQLVNISINAATRQTYKRLMQVDQFDRVCSNAAAFVHERDRSGKQTLLQFSCAISRINIEELPLLVELSARLGVRHLNIMYCRFYPKSIRHLNIDSREYELADEESLYFHQELSDRKVLEAKTLADRNGIVMTHEPLFREKGQPKKCHWTDSELLVGFDGEVYPCGGGEVHFKRKVEAGTYNFGNALTQRIEEFWNNDTYRKLRISCRRQGESPIIECSYCANLMQHDDIRSHIMEWEGFEDDDSRAGTVNTDTDASRPLVSVIVPTHNRPDMLADTLKSVLAQTYPNIEIVVVNDAGDDVRKLVGEVAPDAVYVCHEINRGLAAARNTGIRNAKGKYIAYLDDDDIYYPEHVESLVNFLENSDFKVAYTDAYRALQQREGDRFVTVKRELLYSREFDYDAILVDNFIPVLCIMHEKDCLSRSGMFDESLPRHEDWDLWIRMSRHERFGHLPTITCEFTYRPAGSGMTSETLPLFIQTYRKIYRKYPEHVQEGSQVAACRQATLFNAVFRAYHFIGGKIRPYLADPAMTNSMFSEISPCGATIPQIKSALFWQRALTVGDPEAIPLLEMALSIDADNHPARLALYECLIRDKQFSQALIHMEYLARSNPAEPNFARTRDTLQQTVDIHSTQETPLPVSVAHETTHGDFTAGQAASADSSSRECMVSIIIPLYNEVTHTRQCLEGLEKTLQVAPAHELILVDNGSTDGTRDFLKSLGKDIRIISNPENLGFAKACNQGASIARGTYLLFLNNDTIPQPGWLDALVSGLEQNNADICGAKLLYPDGRVQHAGIAFNDRGIGYHIFKYFASEDAAVSTKRFMRSVTGACMLIKKDLFRDLAGFDEAFTNAYEDVDLCLRAGALGKKILYIPESVLIHFEETSEGRKTNDERNMNLFLSRWSGRVPCDDVDYYREAGYVKQRNQEGNSVIVPTSEEVGRVVKPFSNVIDTELCKHLCDTFHQDPDDRNTCRYMGAAMDENKNPRNQFDNPADKYESIRAGLDHRSTEEAVALVEDFLADEPDFAEAHNDLGVLYYRIGNKLQTLGHYEKAVRLSPRNITYGKNLAGFYFVEMGWIDDAVRLYTEVLKTHPEDTETLTALGIIAGSTGRNEEAGIFFGRVLELEPWNNEVRQAIATIVPISQMEDSSRPSYQKACDLADNGRMEEAGDELERLLAVNADDALVHNDLGVIYTREGNLENALEHHETAVRLAPREPLFRKNLANLYFTAAGRTDEAVRIYSDLLKETPNDTETLGALAIISSAMNRPDQACIFLRRITEIEPSNGDARRLLSELESIENEGFFLTNRQTML